MGSELITVPGRRLEKVIVSYRNNKTPIPEERPKDGSWNMKQMQFYKSVNAGGSWTWLNLKVTGLANSVHNANMFLSLQRACQEFSRVMNRSGISGDVPKGGRELQLANVNDPKLQSELQRSREKLLLIILPAWNTALYNRIKYLADVEIGIHTVCVVAEKFQNGRKTRNDPPGKPPMPDIGYYANVALKVNMKLGGVNHVVAGSKLRFVNEGKTMVVGIDVTHPSPASAGNAPSIAAMVASVSKDLAQWPADLRVQQGRQEMVAKLDEMIKTRLALWIKQAGNGNYPDNILVYRDGVSEGQYEKVLEEELPLLRKGCRESYPATKSAAGFPRITIVVVGKRHHTRFYPTRREDTNESSNPPAGTVVDRGITEARNWDFFMVAHAAIQGTARPAHYFVVCDEIFCKLPLPTIAGDFNAADILENLTHTMCYLYSRATRSVSICPAAYYADIACERARRYLGDVYEPPGSDGGSRDGRAPEPWMERMVKTHEKLKDTMFYL